MMLHRRVQDDNDLVRSAQQGNADAFNKLYERYLPSVYRRVRSVIPESDVEDVTQEVFIAVMKSLKNFRFEALFGTWLRTLVNRQVADYYRGRKLSNDALVSIDAMDDEDHADMRLSVDDGTPSHDDLILMRQALRSLPDNYREIIVLRFVDGLQFDEIAHLQGNSLEATKSLFRRAIAALQKRVTASDG